jgi:hypothetical protein
MTIKIIIIIIYNLHIISLILYVNIQDFKPNLLNMGDIYYIYIIGMPFK